MNLHSVISGVIQSVNQSFIGTLMQSTGYAYPGDASFTGSITSNLLNVTAIPTGALAVGSIIAGAGVYGPVSILSFGTGSGGIGTYHLSPTPDATSRALTATGDGQRTPTYATFTNVPMQFQAVSSDDLTHVDALNISKVMRSVHMNGQIEGMNRPGINGGDVLLAPTGLTGAEMDTWLVVGVPESFDASGWSHIVVTLQAAVQSQ